MEEKDKWIKNLRHRMEDYSEPAPADLWNQLEKELNSTPKNYSVVASLAGSSSNCLAGGHIDSDRMVLAFSFGRICRKKIC